MPATEKVPFVKGEKVVVHGDPLGTHRTIVQVRTRTASWASKGEQLVRLDGASDFENDWRLTRVSDLTPEQVEGFVAARDAKVREEQADKRRAERITAKRKAFKLANPIPSEPVRDGAVRVERSDDRIVVSVPFTTYRYKEDRWSSHIEVETSTWGTVSVDIRRHYRTNALEFSTSGTSDKTAAQLAALGECIAKAIEVCESLPLRDTRVWGTDE